MGIIFPPLQFMKLGGHNAYWGCFTCFVSGEWTDWGMEYPGGPPFHYRRPAHYFSAPVRALGLGIHGTPCMAHLSPPPASFDIIWGSVLDPMHNLFLGVTVNIFDKTWFASDSVSASNIRHLMTQIDWVFLGIAVPHTWTRKPSSLFQAVSDWKGICNTSYLFFFLLFTPFSSFFLLFPLIPSVFLDIPPLSSYFLLLRRRLEEVCPYLQPCIAVWVSSRGRVQSLATVCEGSQSPLPPPNSCYC